MYSQRDGRWAGLTLGFGPDTIGADGCYLTSDADLLTWTGHPITPAELNDLYKANRIYVSGELLYDSALHDAFPNLWSLEEVYHCESFPCDQNKLNNDDPNLYVVVEIQGPGTGSGVHFSPILNWHDWTIADAWTGTERSISVWGGGPQTLIQKVMRYRFIGGAPAPVANTFDVVAEAGARIRTYPGIDMDVVRQTADETLTIDQTCHYGQALHDDFGGPDTDEWFHCSEGWIASGVVKGLPPDGWARQVAAPRPAIAPPTTPPKLPAATMSSLRYPNAIWLASPNFTADRRDRNDQGPSYDLKTGWNLVFHSEDGSEAGTDATFVNPNPGGVGPRSAHFSVSAEGVVHQFVDVKDAAWHAGVFEVNRMSVGIEHEDAGDPDHYAHPPQQLAASSALVNWLQGKLGLPLKVLRHREIVATDCPGDLPVEFIMAHIAVTAQPPVVSDAYSPPIPPGGWKGFGGWIAQLVAWLKRLIG